MIESHHLQAVASSWPPLESRMDELMELFYRRLFQRHPEYQLMFPANMTEQRDKLAKTIAFVIENAGELPRVVPDVKELGSVHADLGVGPADYPKVGLCLLDSMKELLGDEFTPEQTAGWAAAYNLLSGIMENAPPHDNGL